jgi:hypothetical protein
MIPWLIETTASSREAAAGLVEAAKEAVEDHGELAEAGAEASTGRGRPSPY